ncbi:MAG: hypothetical protein H6716_26035 [Polyangiaceae bacterium]|nr:hypothetical protein [Polyangiaceae bacterium]
MAAFVSNLADELSIFSDAGFHLRCFDAHPLREKALRRYATEKVFWRSPRVCAHCDVSIPKREVLLIGHLVDDPGDPLYEFNYLALDKRHLQDWKPYARFRELAAEFQNSDRYLSYYPLVEGKPFRAPPGKLGKAYVLPSRD